MIGIPVGGVRWETNGQYSEELARYVRMEYGDENPEWFLREVRGSSERGAVRRRPFGLRPVAKGLPVAP